MLHPDYHDFRNFLWLIWKSIGLPEPTAVQYDIADYMQSGPNRLMVMAFRGVGKSYINVAFAVWILAKDPQKKIIVVSAGEDLAADFTRFMKSLIDTIPELAFLRTRPGQRDSVLSFDVGPARQAKDPSVYATGIGGQITGHRADLIIADDLETPRTSETLGAREKLSERTREFAALLKPDEDAEGNSSRIVILGTPQCQDTVYAQLPDRGYEIRIWPAETPTEAQLQAYSGRLAPMVLEITERLGPGAPVEPHRFHVKALEERKLDYGPAGYALQFMLDPSLSEADRYPLKLRDLLVGHLDPIGVPRKFIWSPEDERYLPDIPNVGLRGDRLFKALVLPQDDADRYPLKHLVMAIDPSGRGKDETAYAVGTAMNGFFFLLDSGAVPGVSEADMDWLCRVCQRWGVGTIVAEPNYGGGMFKEVLEAALQRNRVQASVLDSTWAKGRKEKRIIETLYPIAAGHRLVVDAGLFQKDFDSVNHLEPQFRGQYRLWYQFTHLSETAGCLVHDDRVEAVSILCDHLRERGAVQNIDDAVRRQEEEAWRQEREKLRRLAGHKPAQPAARPVRR